MTDLAERICAMKDEHPDLSNREIAKRLGCNRRTVDRALRPPDDAYLEHKRAVMKKWRERNRERIQEHRRKTAGWQPPPASCSCGNPIEQPPGSGRRRTYCADCATQRAKEAKRQWRAKQTKDAA